MRQKVANRSPQRHATLPTYYKILLRTEKVLLQYYPVLQSTPPYYKVYSVLQSATPGLLCTTQHYSVVQTTTPVLQSTTPVLLCTTKNYPSTLLHYKVLLQHHSVLQSTTPVLLCTTKYCEALKSTDPVRPPICPESDSFGAIKRIGCFWILKAEAL